MITFAKGSTSPSKPLFFHAHLGRVVPRPRFERTLAYEVQSLAFYRLPKAQVAFCTEQSYKRTA